VDPAVETITCDHLDDLDPGVRHDSTDIAEWTGGIIKTQRISLTKWEI
jgi:hypothetical protein